MVTKVAIRDNTDTPIHYLSKIPIFKNGREFKFKPSVNVIVGDNGSGKSTLMKLIEYYLLVGLNDCQKGAYNCNLTRLFKGLDGNMPKGVDVYADYTKNTFRLGSADEMSDDDKLSDMHSLNMYLEHKRSSTGEQMLLALNILFKKMFSKGAALTFDYNGIGDTYSEYREYVDSHRVECADEYTILMDEPDRNLSIDNIDQISGILSMHKENTQVIAVVHNPIVICKLARKEHINFIETTEGYVDKVLEAVRKLRR